MSSSFRINLCLESKFHFVQNILVSFCYIKLKFQVLIC